MGINLRPRVVNSISATLGGIFTIDSTPTRVSFSIIDDPYGIINDATQVGALVIAPERFSNMAIMSNLRGDPSIDLNYSQVLYYGGFKHTFNTREAISKERVTIGNWQISLNSSIYSNRDVNLEYYTNLGTISGGAAAGPHITTITLY